MDKKRGGFPKMSLSMVYYLMACNSLIYYHGVAQYIRGGRAAQIDPSLFSWAGGIVWRAKGGLEGC